MQRPVKVTHISFIEGSHTTKNLASEQIKFITEDYFVQQINNTIIYNNKAQLNGKLNIKDN